MTQLVDARERSPAGSSPRKKRFQKRLWGTQIVDSEHFPSSCRKVAKRIVFSSYKVEEKKQNILKVIP